VINENAFGVGVTAIPAPFVDLAWDGWLWHTQGNLRCVAASGIGDDIMTSTRIVIDTKAMRKFKESDVLVGVIEFVEDATAVMSAYMESRLLVKLP